MANSSMGELIFFMRGNKVKSKRRLEIVRSKIRDEFQKELERPRRKRFVQWIINHLTPFYETIQFKLDWPRILEGIIGHWMNFWAGLLTKRVEKSRIIRCLIQTLIPRTLVMILYSHQYQSVMSLLGKVPEFYHWWLFSLKLRFNRA